MPVQVASTLIPRNSATWPVVEDTYFKGGFRVCLDTTVRDAINSASRKQGMLVATLADSKIWQMEADLLTWTEFTIPGLLTLTARVAGLFFTFTMDTLSPSLTWDIQHNRNSTHFTLTVISDTGKQVFPDEMEIIDNNNIRLSFLTPQSGHCTLGFDPS